MHKRSAHLESVNAEISVERVKKRWSPEELRLLARVEAQGILGKEKFINEYILSQGVGDRTLDAIKGVRRRQDYKHLVEAAVRELRSVKSPGNLDSSNGNARAQAIQGLSEDRSGLSGEPLNDHNTLESSRNEFEQEIEHLISLVEPAAGYNSEILVRIARQQLNGIDVAESIRTWLESVFPPPPRRSGGNRLQVRSPVDLNDLPSWRKRRRAYAITQKAFKKNPGRVAREVLDGTNVSRPPSLQVMLDYWGPMLMQESTPYNLATKIKDKPKPQGLWRPVSRVELEQIRVPLNSAVGIDGVSARQWRSVPVTIRALFYNIIMARGGFPTEMLASRTIFLPKKREAATATDFRPISIASVVIRQLHKILATRFRNAGLIDVRQRCLEDGCAENIAVLASLLDDAKRRLRELHIVSLDCAKAFDSVSHEAIAVALRENNLPEGMISYITNTYSRSMTYIEVGSSRSEPVHVGRGVRQGDPLSTLIFCLVLDKVTRQLPSNIGYDLGGTSINTLLYADDTFLVASTVQGMSVLVKAVEESAESVGLSFNTSKCSALSIVPSGKDKRSKVITTPQFELNKSKIAQLSPSQEWRYLGVDFRPIGPKKAGGTLMRELERITRAPLKPQQRLHIIRSFLLPRLYHRLVLAGTTLGKLRSLDLQVRSAARNWLRLPPDVPKAYFHAPVREGGLGLPSFETSVPSQIIERFEGLAQSTSPAARAAHEEVWVQKRIRWAYHALTKKDGEALRSKQDVDRWWSKSLHGSVDGHELRESAKVSASSSWVQWGMALSGRDYVQYHHVRINSLPTLTRTSRGVRRIAANIACRAGCQATETAAHVVQACHRTHGGRIMRHDAICEVLRSGLRDKGWAVEREPRFRTSQGVRKPDIVATREGHVCVLDAQVVSGATTLDGAHERKCAYYGDNQDLRSEVGRRYNVRPSDIIFRTCTLSWRGIWSLKSVDDLLAMGLPRGILGFITLRAIRGSHTNWTRWNKMTGFTITSGKKFPRLGIG